MHMRRLTMDIRATALLALFLFAPVFGQQRPTNDECDGAIDIPVGTVRHFVTTGATDSSNYGCYMSKDVWYSFSATQGVPMTISTCRGNNGSATFDTILGLYYSCRNTDWSAYCEDDSCAPGTGSTISFLPRDTTTIYVRVGGSSPSDSGSGDMSVYTPDLMVTAPSSYYSYYIGDEVYITWYTSRSSSEFVRITWTATNVGSSGVIEERAPNTGSYLWTIPSSVPTEVGYDYFKYVTVSSLSSGTTSRSGNFAVRENYLYWNNYPYQLYIGVPFVATWTYNGPDDALVSIDLYIASYLIPLNQTGFVANLAQGITASRGISGIHVTIPSNVTISRSVAQYVLRLHWTNVPSTIYDSTSYVQIMTPTAPLPATNLRVIPSSVTSSEATISWTAPVVVSQSLAIVEYWLNLSYAPGHFLPATPTIFTIKNLRSSTMYTASVMSYNGAVFSAPSNVITFTTPAGTGEQPPDPPTNVQCMVYGSNTIVVSWTGISGANSGYQVEATAMANAPRVNNVITNAASATFNTLAAGVQYQFQVSTRSSPYGTRLSMASAPISCTTTTDVPEAPPVPKLVSWGAFDIKLSWSGPFLNGGADIANYRITVQSPSEPASQIMTDAVSTNYHIEALAPNTEYVITIAAKNRIGFSAESPALTVTTDLIHQTPSGSSTTSAPETNYYTNVLGSSFGSSFFAVMLAAVVLGVFFGIYKMIPAIRNRLGLTGYKYSTGSTNDERESFSQSFSRA